MKLLAKGHLSYSINGSKKDDPGGVQAKLELPRPPATHLQQVM